MSAIASFRDSPAFKQVAPLVGGALLLSILVFAAWYSFLRTSFAPVFTSLATEDAALIVEELKRQKTPFELADQGATIKVAEDRVDATRIVILGGDLPLKGTVGFELFNKSDMGLTEFAQKINYQRALQGELARTLMSLEGVETARVHLSLKDAELFREDQRRAKASVTITTRLGAALGERTVVGVQRMVASAVPDLESGDVAVLDGTGQVLSKEPQSATSLMPSTQERDAVIQILVADIREALASLLPDQASTVSVWVPQSVRLSMLGENSSSTEGTQRPFPIRVSVSLLGRPETEIRAKLIPVLEQSIDFASSRGDVLEFTDSSSIEDASPIAPALVPAPVTNGRPPEDSQSSESWQIGSLFWILAGVLVALVGLFWARNRFFKRPLARNDREAFANRLSRLLEDTDEARRGQA